MRGLLRDPVIAVAAAAGVAVLALYALAAVTSWWWADLAAGTVRALVTIGLVVGVVVLRVMLRRAWSTVAELTVELRDERRAGREARTPAALGQFADNELTVPTAATQHREWP